MSTSSEWGQKYPTTVTAFEASSEKPTSFLSLPRDLLRVICTTNAIESSKRQFRIAAKNREDLPSDDVAVKLPCLAMCTIQDRHARARAKERGTEFAVKRKTARRLVEGQITAPWSTALAQLAVAHPDRINHYL